MRVHNVIIKPIITEKALSQTARGLYVFEVDVKANKHMIKETIEKIFKDITVASVKTMVTHGKQKRVGRRMKTKQSPDTKKAYIYLSKGKIDIIPSSQ